MISLPYPLKQPQPEPEPEPEAVRLAETNYRLMVFLGIGFSLADAESLAISTVSMHDARRLVDSGCPPRTATDILL